MRQALRRAVLVVAGAFAAGCSGGGGGSPTSVTPQGPPPPPPPGVTTTTTSTTLPQATTTTLPGPTSIAGRWVGELIVTQNANCNEENDLTLELTQNGTSVSGSGALLTRRPANCGGNSLSIVGTVGAGTVDLTASGQRDGFAFSLRLRGSASGTRMAGSFECSVACNQSGTWTLDR